MSVWNALTLRRPLPAFTISRATTISIAASIAFAVVTLLALDLANDQLHRFFYDPGSLKIYLPLGGAAAVAAIFYNTRYEDFSGLLKACLRASAAGLLVLLIVEAPDFSLGRPEGARALAFVNDFYPFALLF